MVVFQVVEEVATAAAVTEAATAARTEGVEEAAAGAAAAPTGGATTAANSARRPFPSLSLSLLMELGILCHRLRRPTLIGSQPPLLSKNHSTHTRTSLTADRLKRRQTKNLIRLKRFDFSEKREKSELKFLQFAVPVRARSHCAARG